MDDSMKIETKKKDVTIDGWQSCLDQSVKIKSDDEHKTQANAKLMILWNIIKCVRVRSFVSHEKCRRSNNGHHFSHKNEENSKWSNRFYSTTWINYLIDLYISCSVLAHSIFFCFLFSRQANALRCIIWWINARVCFVFSDELTNLPYLNLFLFRYLQIASKF